MADVKNSDNKKRILRIALPLWLGSALSIVGDSTIYAVLPLYVTAVGITLTDAGTLMGINRLVRLFSNNIFGALFDFGNRKAVFMAALFLGAAATLMFGFCKGLALLSVSRIMWGFAWSGILIGGTNILMEQTTAENRGKWTGMHYFWIMVGHAIGSLLGGYLSDKIGFQNAMKVNGFITLIGAFGVFLTLPNLDRSTTEKLTFASLKQNYAVTLDKKLWLYAVILGLSRFVFSGFVVTFISVISKDKIFPFITIIGISTLTGLISGSKTAIGMVSTPLAGFLSDKFKNRLWAVVISLLFGVAGLFVLTLAPPFFPLIGLCLCAIPEGSVMVLVRTLVGDYAAKTRNQGRSIGFVLTAGDIGSAIGPMLAFRVLPVLGMEAIFRILAVLLAILILVILLFIKTDKKAMAAESNETENQQS